MSGSNPGSLATTPFWHWDTTTTPPTILGFSQSYFNKNGTDQLTKTGLLSADLQNFVGIELARQGLVTNPLSTQELTTYIRYAEDEVEQFTGLLLCPTWIASPAEVTSAAASASGLLAAGQRLGVDYDLADAAYDFDLIRFKDEGWGFLNTRYRPLRTFNPSETNYTAIQNVVYIYPLLNQYFAIPRTWFVEEQDFGLARFVPSQNVQMLPLFAMQLALMGFSQSLPGAMHLQYTAGLTDNDHTGRFSFIKRLVLTKAASLALSTIQGTFNLGAIERGTTVDGLSDKVQYKSAPFAAIIKQWDDQAKQLMAMALDQVSGPMVDYF